MKTTGINFCRLTNISEQKYLERLFEQGCVFAEYYCSLLPKGYSKILLNLPSYWQWWNTQWNIRTQGVFKKLKIDENSRDITTEEKNVLINAFYNIHELENIKVYPNKIVQRNFNKELTIK